jgi:precorrin-4/cobalt-precorrin-4 C11-methyltransferase
MAIFLSVGMIEEVAEQLMTHYPVDTPVAVVKKASWIDEEIVLTTLDKVAEIVKRQGIHKTAQILVGDFISTDYEKSKLYDKAFSHEYRKGTCV